MSSTVFLHMDPEVEAADWADFCRSQGIVRSPGASSTTFHANARRVSVDIDVESQHAAGPVLKSLDVSSLFCMNLDEVAQLVRTIVQRFPGTISPAPELAHMLCDLPHHYARDPLVLADRLPTDEPGGWSRHGRMLRAAVDAGTATIAPDGRGMHVLRLDGIVRATYPGLEDAMLVAGRMDWSFWGGRMPEVLDARTDQAALSGPPDDDDVGLAVRPGL